MDMLEFQTRKWHLLSAWSGQANSEAGITHCQTHHRSSHTYIVLKALGFPRIKGYPGSWSEWGNDFELPIET